MVDLNPTISMLTLSVNDPNTLIQRQTLSDIVLKIKQNGINLRKEKKPLIISSIGKNMEQLEFSSIVSGKWYHFGKLLGNTD